MPDNDLTDAAEAFVQDKTEHFEHFRKLVILAFVAGAIWQQKRTLARKRAELAAKQAELANLTMPVLEAVLEVDDAN